MQVSVTELSLRYPPARAGRVHQAKAVSWLLGKAAVGLMGGVLQLTPNLLRLAFRMPHELPPVSSSQRARRRSLASRHFHLYHLETGTVFASPSWQRTARCRVPKAPLSPDAAQPWKSLLSLLFSRWLPPLHSSLICLFIYHYNRKTTKSPPCLPVKSYTN